jgi:hypothetical protein
MAIKTITRAAAGAASGIAGLSLIIAAPANAINKHEPGGGNVNVAQVAESTYHGRDLDSAQIAAGVLGGIAVTGAGFAASGRLRRHNRSAHRLV